MPIKKKKKTARGTSVVAPKNKVAAKKKKKKKKKRVNGCRKGKEGERESANRLKELGSPDARRTEQHNGSDGLSDVVANDTLPSFFIEVKREEHLNVHKAHTRALEDVKAEKRKVDQIAIVHHRKNATEWLVSLSDSDWYMLARAYERELIRDASPFDFRYVHVQDGDTIRLVDVNRVKTLLCVNKIYTPEEFLQILRTDETPTDSATQERTPDENQDGNRDIDASGCVGLGTNDAGEEAPGRAETDSAPSPRPEESERSTGTDDRPFEFFEPHDYD